MRLKNIVKGFVGTIATALAVPMMATAKPDIHDDLNNFDPTYPIGEYIIELSSNTVNNVVTLTNGVLTVNGESINVAEPTHTVVTTNVIEGRIVITTNVYDAVYQDGLDKALESYATIYKDVYTENEDGSITTNKVPVAYMDDIPADSEKADKVINLWEYYCPQVDGVLSRSESRIAPFASWTWTGDKSGVNRIDLTYTNGVWECLVNSTPPALSVRGEEAAKSLNFGDYTFASTNENGVAYVVYTDALNKAKKDFIDNEMTKYVSKTNLYGLSYRIAETNLHTIGGIVAILRGIRSELNSIAGGTGIHLKFENVNAGVSLTLVGAEMVAPGDVVEIDWGDGTAKQMTTIPVTHTYESAYANIEVVINGFIKEIRGANLTQPFAHWSDGSNSRLQDIIIDQNVGLESLGEYAFYGNTGLSNMNFAYNKGIKSVGDFCFGNTYFVSLEGFPAVEEIPSRCFSMSALTSLNHMPSTVKKIGDYAFEGCSSIASIGGIADASGLTELGIGAFNNCSSLKSLYGLDQTQIVDIPDGCFMNCSQLESIAYLNPATTNIGSGAFSNCGLTSLNGIPLALKEIGALTFSVNNQLIDAKALWNTQVKLVGDNAFKSCDNLQSITFPESIEYLGNTVFEYCGSASTATPKITVKFRGKTIDEVVSLPQSPSVPTTAFPWGLAWGNIGDVLIVAQDGELTYDSDTSSWVTNITRTAFRLTGIESGDVVSLGTITEVPVRRDEEPDANAIYVDWGDGTTDTNRTHTYASSISPTISVMGKMDEIGGTNGLPFVSVNGSSINDNLISISIGSGVGLKSIGKDAFVNCTSLNEVSGIGDSLVTVGESAFKGATLISSLEFLPSSVENIGKAAFMGCTSLASIDELPPSITSISEDCFRGCSSLTNLSTSLTDVKTIGANAFAECRNVAIVSLPSVESVGSRAFSGLGDSLPNRHTEDNLPYKVKVDMKSKTFADASTILGLRYATEPTSGLTSANTIIECKDDKTLAYNNSSEARRWEVLFDALEISLENVASNTSFVVQTDGAGMVAPEASAIWNWGDGTSSGWVAGYPRTAHTYDFAGNYVIKVKGLIDYVQGDFSAGPMLHPVGVESNSYIVGFHLPSGSSVKRVGNYAFSRCPNLKSVNELSYTRSLKKKVPSREVYSRASADRLVDLYAVLTNSESEAGIEFGEGCFSNSGIVDLHSMPETRGELAARLFFSCANLVSLQGLSGNIIDIGDSCFQYDSSLKNLNGFPSSAPYISNYMFADCTGLLSLSGLEGTSVSSLGEYAFNNCINLKSLYGMPSQVRYMGAGAFSSTGLQNMEYLSSGITNLPSLAFYNCIGLSSMQGMPSSVESVDTMGFFNCSNLISSAGVSPNLKTVGRFAFGNLVNDRTFVFNSKVEKMSRLAFLSLGINLPTITDEDGNTMYGTVSLPYNTCRELYAILTNPNDMDNDDDQVPEGIRFICSDGYLIMDSTGLAVRENFITLSLSGVPAGTEFSIGYVTAQEPYSFNWDWGDGTIEYGLTNKPNNHTYAAAGNYTIRISGRLDNFGGATTNVPVIATVDGVGSYLSNFYIGGGIGVTELGDDCFASCSDITSLDGISLSRVQKLGDRCFKDAASLTSLNGITTKVLNIGEECFSGCRQLADYSSMTNLAFNIVPSGCFKDNVSMTSLAFLPGTIDTIGMRAFEGCTGLTNLTGLPDILKGLQEWAFAGCIGLESLNGLPSACSVLGDYSFAGCINLTDLSALSATKVDTLPNGCFSNDVSIVSLEGIPTNIFSIGEGCFADCAGLNTLVGMPTNVIEIGSHAFAHCGGLRNLEGLSPNLVQLSDGTFSGCIGLASLSGITTNIIQIGARCFAGCTALTDSISLSSSVNYIGEGVFSGCSSLTDLDIIKGTSIDYLPAETFNECGSLTDISGMPIAVFGLGDRCFKDCGITSVGNLSTNVVCIGTECFAGCRSLASVGELGEIVELKDGIFPGCTNLAGTVLLPNSLVMVMSNAFNECVLVNRLVLGTNVASIAANSFKNIGAKVQGEQPIIQFLGKRIREVLRADGFPWEAPTNVVFSADGGTIEWIDGEWSLRPSVITFRFQNASYGIVSIAPNAAQIYEDPDNHEKTHYDIYWGDGMVYKGLTNNVPQMRAVNPFYLPYIALVGFVKELSGTSIGNGGWLYVRDGFSNLLLTEVEVTADSSLMILGDNALSGWTTLENVVFENSGIQQIGTNCFNGCTGLTSLNLPTTLESIGHYCFSNCTRLAYIKFPTSIRQVPATAFCNVGKDATAKFNDDGDEYRSEVIFEGKTCREIIGMLESGVSKAIVTNSISSHTMFVGEDGSLFLVDGKWKTNNDSIVLYLRGIGGGDEVEFGDLIASAGEDVVISFGDGQSVRRTGTVSGVDHTYAEARDYMVRITGNVQELRNRSGSNSWCWNRTKGMACIGKVVVGIDCSLNSIGASCFAQNEVVESFQLDGTNLTTIGTGAFANCNNTNGMWYVMLPSSVSTIAENAFLNATNACIIFTGKNISALPQMGGVVAWGASGATEYLCDDKMLVLRNGEWVEDELPEIRIELGNLNGTYEQYTIETSQWVWKTEMVPYEVIVGYEDQDVGTHVTQREKQVTKLGLYWVQKKSPLSDIILSTTRVADGNTPTKNLKRPTPFGYWLRKPEGYEKVKVNVTSVMRVRVPIKSIEYKTVFKLVEVKSTRTAYRVIGNTSVDINVTPYPGTRLQYRSETISLACMNSDGGNYTRFFTRTNSTKTAFVPKDKALRINFPTGTTNAYIVLKGKVKAIGSESRSRLVDYYLDNWFYTSRGPKEDYIQRISFTPNCGLETLGSNLFSYPAKWIGDVGVLPPSVVTIGERCFLNNLYITNLAFMANTRIKSIPLECFKGCYSLESMEGLPATVETIGEGAFRECMKLKDIRVGDGVKDIGRYAFACWGNTDRDDMLMNLTLPNANIGGYCFMGRDNIEYITLSSKTEGEEEKSIGTYAFSSCTNLRAVLIKEGYGRLRDDSFEGTRNVKVGIVGQDSLPYCTDPTYAVESSDFGKPLLYFDNGDMVCVTDGIRGNRWKGAVTAVVSVPPEGRRITLNYVPQIIQYIRIVNWGDGMVDSSIDDSEDAVSISHDYEGTGNWREVKIVVMGGALELGDSTNSLHFVEGVHSNELKSINCDYLSDTAGIARGAFAGQAPTGFVHNRRANEIISDPLHGVHSDRTYLPRLQYVEDGAFTGVTNLNFVANSNTKSECLELTGIAEQMKQGWIMSLQDLIGGRTPNYDMVTNLNEGAIMLRLVDVPASTAFVVNGNKIKIDSPYLAVDWGDGWVDYLERDEDGFATSLPLVHMYSNAMNSVVVRLVGRIDTILPRPVHTNNIHTTDYLPLLSESSTLGWFGEKNPYLQSAKIDDAVGLREAPPRMFYGSGKLTELMGGSTITNLGAECFAWCERLKQLFDMPKSVSIIGDDCFVGCTSLQSLDGDEFQSGLEGLTNLTYIGHRAFRCGRCWTGTFPESFNKVITWEWIQGRYTAIWAGKMERDALLRTYGYWERYIKARDWDMPLDQRILFYPTFIFKSDGFSNVLVQDEFNHREGFPWTWDIEYPNFNPVYNMFIRLVWEDQWSHEETYKDYLVGIDLNGNLYDSW